jgi:hypothetical protein
VSVTHFVSFADGSGAEMLMSAIGMRFQASFIAGQVTVRPLSDVSFRSRSGAFRMALRDVEAEMTKRVAALGPEWLAAHRAMYGVAS